MRHSRNFLSTARIALALAGIFLTFNLVAQEDESQIQGRYLFIFSTSAEMKNRVPATQAEINQLLGLSMNGALHSGDSIGIWTFDKTIHVGQFPLIYWRPDDAESIATAINKFVGKQRYTSTNNFNALLPVLERVIQSSPRLTVLIFCDGGGEINGTPYDDSINPAFKQQFAQEKKARQPFIVVLRAQLGKYAGSSVNIPPGMVSLPTFPPISKPQPPAPSPQPVVANTPPPAPVEPLVIIGTRVETNWQAYQFALTNVPQKSASTEQTNEEKSNASSQNPALTNAGSLPATNLTSATNTVSSRTDQSPDRKGALALAAGFLLGAIALAAIFIFRSRRADHGSLISRSMKK